MAEEDVEYESDPEEAKLSLKMRRKEASDDEDADEDEEEKAAEIRGKLSRRIGDSDVESEGAAPDYEDELAEEEDYELEEYAEEIEVVGGVDYEGSGNGMKAVAVEMEDVGKDGGELRVEETLNTDTNEIYDENHDNNHEDGPHEREKKEIEPFSVPTAGAFYMHDDRFSDSAGGRHRRTPGGRKLWESKDDRKWGHDKYEELTVQERSYGESRRGSRGRSRGRGRNRGGDRGYVPRNGLREHTDNSTENNNNQNNAPKSVRGRGPRRYQPSSKNNEAPLAQNRQSGKFVEKPSYGSSVRTSESMFNTERDVSLPRKQVLGSSLNIASPPFYPSGSSTKDKSVASKRDVLAGSVNQNGQPSVIGDSITMARSSGMLHEKNAVDSIGMDKLSINDSLSTMGGRPANGMQKPLSGTSYINSTQQQWRGQGRGISSMTQMAYQPALSNNRFDRFYPQNHPQNVQRNPGQSHAQSSLPASSHQYTGGFPGGSEASSPPKATGTVNAVESGELKPPTESITSKTALVTNGKGSMQGSGMGSFLYGGAQIMGTPGNMGSGQGDQNYPTFLPVMQFGGQHPGRIGVPAVGMAFPGYVGQPQRGSGNSEMTWLPVLAGAAGGLGTGYGPPYISVDGSYHAHPSGQLSSVAAASSKENDAKNVSNDWKPAQRPGEVANDDLGQRQKNPRRYTEMKFDQ